jgi:cysteine-rich repeat protein
MIKSNLVKNKLIFSSVFLVFLFSFISAVQAQSFDIVKEIEEGIGDGGADPDYCGRGDDGDCDTCNSESFSCAGEGACWNDEYGVVSPGGCFFWDISSPRVTVDTQVEVPLAATGSVDIITFDYGQGTWENERVEVYINGQLIGITEDNACNSGPDCNVHGPFEDTFNNVQFNEGVNTIQVKAVEGGGSVSVDKLRLRGGQTASTDCQIYGFVFRDNNQNGVYDAGDAGISDRIVTLSNQAHTATVKTTNTIGTGFYLMDGLDRSSDRRISHEIPSGYFRTTDDSKHINFADECTQQWDFGIAADSICGDGNIDQGEQCDDGNDNNDDRCTNDCLETFCGDGSTQNPNNDGIEEQCDDGNDNNNDGCTNDCIVPSNDCRIKGYVFRDNNKNGDFDAGDEGISDRLVTLSNLAGTVTIVTDTTDNTGFYFIDGRDRTSDRRISHVIPLGYFRTTDDSKPVDFAEQCLEEWDFGIAKDSVCGDGNVDDGEQCDDGNTNDNDGCSSTCQNEIPSIQIIKLAGNASDGQIFKSFAGTVTYTYKIKNTGQTYLNPISAVDDKGTPLNPDDDLLFNGLNTPVLNGLILAPNSEVIFTKDIEVTKNTTNIVVVTGTASDSSGSTWEGNVTDYDDAVVEIFTPGQLTCEQAITMGLLFGSSSAGTAAITNSADQTFEVGYAVYKMIDDIIENQILFNYSLANIGPNETVNFDISVPDCRYQTDLFCGPLVLQFNDSATYDGRLIDSEFDVGGDFCPVNGNGCFSRIADADVTCNGGAIIQDSSFGCRQVICQAAGKRLKVLGCDKPSATNPSFFELYKQEQIGNGLEICYGDVCISNAGFVKSPGYPICGQGGPTCTDNDDDSFNQEGGACGLVDCNDNNNSIRPGMAELCNGVDDNCNGQVDEGSVCAQGPVCGNSQTESGEQCDDGNTNNGDGCSSTCQTETSTGCHNSVEFVPVTCSQNPITTDTFNGCRKVVCSGKQILACDKSGFFEMYNQGGDNSVEICLGGACMSNEGYVKSSNFPICSSGSNPSPVCGNSQTESGEQCDDGNTNNGDGCSSTCQNEFCGDGNTQGGLSEQCDDGNTNNGDGCSSTCQTESAGSCYNSLETLPASCSASSITLDQFNGCRKVVCSGKQILACPKTGFFEMYNQGGSSSVEICLGNTCMSNSGYVKSSNFPICL